jgi:hypothetical protein
MSLGVGDLRIEPVAHRGERLWLVRVAYLGAGAFD